jgi:hypothetical protein
MFIMIRLSSEALVKYICMGRGERGVREKREIKSRERDTERQRDRETERQRDRETERQRDRETERQRDINKHKLD